MSNLKFPRWRMLCLLATLVPLPALAADAPDPAARLVFMTENYPPLNYTENGQLKGLAIDLLEQMLIHIGSHKRRSDFQVLPWKRAYQRTLSTPGSVLFAMTRTRERETLFRWVGPITRSSVVLMARKDRHLKLTDLSQLARYRTAAVGGDVAQQILGEQSLGTPQIIEVNSAGGAARMLILKRIDLWAYAEVSARQELQRQGANPADFEVAWDFGQIGGDFFAFHRDTPDALIEPLQQALDSLKNDSGSDGLSTYQRLYKLHIH